MLQKAGGVAAMVEATAYIVGIAIMLTVMAPLSADSVSAVPKLTLTLENKILYQVWMLFIYVLFGVALVVLAVALHERLKRVAPSLMQIATPFGLIWAGMVIASGMISNVGLNMAASVFARDPGAAAALWQSVNAIHDGIGGAVEVVGGLWLLLLSWAAMRGDELPSPLNYLGLLVGVAGVLTVIPGLSALGMLFGLGQIVWFLWLGAVLLRTKQPSGTVVAELQFKHPD